MSKKRPDFGKKELGYDTPPNYDDYRPTFCFQHIRGDFSVKGGAMDKDAKAAMLEQLETLACLTWAEIKRSGRHALGMEKIGVSQLKMTMPSTFEEEEHVLVFRYHGKLPMAGVRRQAMFHLVAVEANFNDLYDH